MAPDQTTVGVPKLSCQCPGPVSACGWACVSAYECSSTMAKPMAMHSKRMFKADANADYLFGNGGIRSRKTSRSKMEASARGTVDCTHARRSSTIELLVRVRRVELPRVPGASFCSNHCQGCVGHCQVCGRIQCRGRAVGAAGRPAVADGQTGKAGR